MTGCSKVLLTTSSQERTDYLRRSYGLDQEPPTHYDPAVNTDRLVPEQPAALIIAAAG